jgi:Holliday junction DNA helicase RuvA
VIGRLRGVLAEVGEEEALVDVGGVGYLVRCGARTLGRLPPIGEEAVLHIDSQTREDGTRLYGFLTRGERHAFILLQAIQGVGPKAALAVLDVLPPAELAAAVAREDKALVARAQGVGPKLAQRIVVELKDKAIGGAGEVLAAHATPAGAPIAPAAPSVAGEAVAALMGLGTAEPAARRAVDQALARLGETAALPQVIKGALQELGR